MKILLLASAAVLTLGLGSAFAETGATGFDNTQQSATSAQTGSTAVPAPESYAYNNGQYAYNNGQYDGQFTAAPSAPAQSMTIEPSMPPSAAEAYQGDAPGGI